MGHVVRLRIRTWNPWGDALRVIASSATATIDGWMARTLPVGVQLVAGYGREDLLIQIAARLEEAQPWAERWPAIHACMHDNSRYSKMEEEMVATVAGPWVGEYWLGSTGTFVQIQFGAESLPTSGQASMPFEHRTDLAVVVDEVASGRIHFTIQTDPAPLTFAGQIQNDEMVGDVTSDGKHGRFHLIKIADLPVDVYDAYTGCYQLGSERFISISNFRGELRCDYPVYVDFASGEIRALFPKTDTDLIAGPAFLRPVPVQARAGVQHEAGRVIGLRWQQDEQTLWAPKIRFRQVEALFSNRHITLAGSLTLPLTDPPYPAVILLHGSGPQTRDYADLRFIADFFALHGIAVLAYDKRGTGGSIQEPDDTTLDDLADDALAGLAFLQQQAEIRPDQIGLWGLSQGGWIAPSAAARSSAVAFVIIVSGPGVSVIRQDLDRIEHSMRADHFAEEEIQAAVTHQRLFSEVMATGQGWKTLARSIESAQRSRWASYVSLPTQGDFEQKGARWGRFRTFDPVPYLQRLTCPVLAFFGEVDTVVPPEPNATIMMDALKRGGNQDFTIKVLANASHTMLSMETGSHGEIPDVTQFVPGYFETMVNWLQQRVTLNK